MSSSAAKLPTEPAPQTGATIKDVARHAGVSIGTVSNVLRKHPGVKKRLREQVEQAVAQLGYKPNRLAASLRQKRTRTVGLIIPNIRNAFFIELADALEDLALADGFELIMQTSKEDAGRTLEHIRTLAARRVEGLLAIPTIGPDSAFRELADTGLPVILVDRIEDENPFPSVALENRDAAMMGTRHLVELGHRRIALIINTQELTNGRHRIEGFQAAAREAGIGDGCQVLFCGMGQDQAYAQIRELLAGDDRPTALITVTNLATIGALRAINNAGLRIPDDVSLLAFDDADFLTIVPPYITAIRQPTRQIAAEAWRMLRQALEGDAPDQHVRLQAEIVMRASTGRPKT